MGGSSAGWRWTGRVRLLLMPLMGFLSPFDPSWAAPRSTRTASAILNGTIFVARPDGPGEATSPDSFTACANTGRRACRNVSTQPSTARAC